MDIQYLTLLERILFLLVEFCKNVPGSYCRDCVDTGCCLECCFYQVELLEACLCCVALECCRGAGSLILPCRILGDTGNSCWKEPARDEPCSCSISWILVEELILYIELTVETCSCWIACGSTVEYTVFEEIL